jgi:hypothetical protein
MVMPRCRRLPSVWAWALVGLFAVAAQARAGDLHYMMVFSAQGAWNVPSRSHTFAVFARLVTCGPCRLEYHTLSWMPADMEVRAGRLLPQAGRNLDVATTVAWAARQGDRVSMWGPFRIRPELYELALRRIAELERGQVAYKAMDWGYRPDLAVDCIRAVSGIDMSRGLLMTDIAHGDRASYLVLMHLRPWIIDPCTIHPWVSRALGLDRYAVVQQNWWRRPVLLRYRPA